ncbi:ANR53 protein, partial [Atractosteus spatula]|nr:ANR53 protein [Atractosteus spatula]
LLLLLSGAAGNRRAAPQPASPRPFAVLASPGPAGHLHPGSPGVPTRGSSPTPVERPYHPLASCPPASDRHWPGFRKVPVLKLPDCTRRIPGSAFWRKQSGAPGLGVAGVQQGRISSGRGEAHRWLHWLCLGSSLFHTLYAWSKSLSGDELRARRARATLSESVRISVFGRAKGEIQLSTTAQGKDLTARRQEEAPRLLPSVVWGEKGRRTSQGTLARRGCVADLDGWNGGARPEFWYSRGSAAIRAWLTLLHHLTMRTSLWLFHMLPAARAAAAVCPRMPGPGESRKGSALRGAPPDSDMFQAAAAGDTAWLRLSLRGVTSAAQPGRNGLTVLHVAALHGRLECLRLLLEAHHMDVNTSCPGGWKPVHLAISSRSGDRANACLSYLLAQGAQPSVRSDDGTTPLHRAAGEGLLDCTVTLVQAGAELSARDSEGHTPLDTAKLWGYRAIASSLHHHSPLSARELTEHQSYVTAGVSNLDLGCLASLIGHLFLKDAVWRTEKQEQAAQCRQLQQLKQRLLRTHQELQQQTQMDKEHFNQLKFEQWAQKKGLPGPSLIPRNSFLRSRGVPPDSPTLDRTGAVGEGRAEKSPPMKVLVRGPPREAWNRSTNPARTPRAAISRPHGVRLGTHPEEEARDPDLTGCVVLTQGWDRQTLIMPAWGGRPLPAPPLPQDVLHRSLFPRSHLSRITSPCDFVPTHLQDLPRRRRPSTDGSPWTEVAMHLSEALQPGHY